MARLLAITNLYPPQNLGGFGLCIQRLTDGLQRRGYEPLVITSDQTYLNGKDTRILPEPGVQRQLQLLGSYQGGVTRLGDQAEEALRHQHNLKAIEAVLMEHRPGACLVGNLDLLGWDLLMPVLQAGIPVIQHVGFMAAPFPLKDFPRQSNYRMAFASGEVRRLLVHQGYPVAAHPVVHPPLSSDLLPDPTQPSSDSTLRIGYCGLLMHSKGVHVLLDACKRIKTSGAQFELRLAGNPFSPDYDQALRRFVLESNLTSQVHWKGFLELEALTAFYQDLDVLVFPSLHPESFGMVVAEAMACGVVPISSGVGGAFEVITHQVDGLLCEPGDSQNLAQLLHWCCNNRHQLLELGARGRRHAQLRFTPEQAAARLDQTFREMQLTAPPINPKSVFF